MSTSPNYSFNKKPQFSVNHLAEYLATTNATQRTKVITAAKFPKKVEVATYGQVRTALRNALTKPAFGKDDLDFLADRLETKVAREAGWNRDEAMRCLRAVHAFQATLQPRSLSQCELSAAPRGLSVSVEGVKINVTLDATVTATKGDVTNVGGIVLLYAFSTDRGDLKDRLQATSGLMLWALEGGQMEPLPRLCMTIDLAENATVKASGAHSRFRSRVSESCKEIDARWDDIEPPHDYDGPDWR